MSTPERIYECEVKRRFLKAEVKGEYVSRWKTVPVREVIENGETARCKDCHGRVKLHGKHVANGPAPHAEHFSRQDSEHCPSGHYFQQATDGRSPRLSSTPVT